MKNLTITAILFLFSLIISAQSLTKDRDESIYIKGNSKVYIGVDSQQYAYSIKRTNNELGLVFERQFIDTISNTKLYVEGYQYMYPYNSDKIDQFNRYHFVPYGYVISEGFQISRNENNERTGLENWYHKDSLNLDSMQRYYDRYVYLIDEYTYTASQITGVKVKKVDYYTNQYTGGVTTYLDEIKNIVWLDYEKEIKKTYDVKRGSDFNTVFFNYKDSYGSYDKTERKLVDGIWNGVRRETRNFDYLGLNSITIADSTSNGWEVTSKVSYTYHNGAISSITKVLQEGGVVTYTEKEIFDNYVAPYSNLRRSEAIELMVFDLRDEVITGLSEENNSIISMYPNPSAGRVNLSGLSKSKKTISFINTQGVTVLALNTADNSLQLDLNLSSGLYMVNIQEADGTSTVKSLVVN